MSPSDSSSEEEDVARFAAVAIDAVAIDAAIERSKQVAAQRQKRARQRRAGGGGVLGAVHGDSSGDEGEAGASVFLDAAQLKVAEALQRRLQAELEEVPAVKPAPAVAAAAKGERQQQQGTPAAAATEQEQQADEGGGVRLFRRVKPGAPVVDRQQQTQQQQAQRDDHAEEQSSSRRVADLRHLKAPTKSRCQAAAVEADDILRKAAALAQQARQNIASPPGWLPADDDPSRWSHRRKRRAAKLAAEAAEGRERHQRQHA